MEGRWEEVGEWRVDSLVGGLQAYERGDDPIYPPDDRRLRALHGFLYERKPDPRGFLPLFGPHDYASVDEPGLLKRDILALAVVTSFIRRLFEDPRDIHREALYDAIAAAGIHFAFEPLYGDSHTATGVEVGDFFGDAKFPVNDASRGALARHLPALIEQWRGRTSDKSTSAFCGIVLRHLGAPGGDVLFGEWERMHVDERYDLLQRAADQEALGPVARRRIVDAVLDPSWEVREAAFKALRAHAAPLGDLDASARDEEIEAGLEALRRWAQKTKS
ncbi:MAG: hypothetical protein ACYTEZ_09180 [Planctomycetota bacterium]